MLYGSVLSDPNDRPLPGAEVSLGHSLTARTDSAGDFVINAVPPGVYRVLVRHLGNTPISTILNFAPGDSVGRDFVLALDVTQLDTVHVVAKPDGVKVYEPKPGQLPFDINSIPADALQGIEMYNSYATPPPQYSGAGARCGTILLWMK